MKKFAFSVVLSSSLILVSLSPVAYAGPALIDEFSVVKNGITIFTDPFDDGVPPPSAPNFSNGFPASYFVTGTLDEAGGRVRLDNVGAAVLPPGPFAPMRFFEQALLLTDRDPSNLELGLKIDDTFKITGRYDLTIPAVNVENYGIRLTDATPLNPGDNHVLISVLQGGDGVDRVVFLRIDLIAGTVTGLASTPLDTGHDQISLSLERLSLGSDAITASFNYIDGGVDGPTTTFGATTDIFNGENFTRAAFERVQPVPVAGSLILMGAGLAALGACSLRRRPRGPSGAFRNSPPDARRPHRNHRDGGAGGRPTGADGTTGWERGTEKGLYASYALRLGARLLPGLVLCVGLVLLTGSPVAAVPLTVTFDLSTGTFGANSYTSGPISFAAQTLPPGGTLDVLINFLGGQQLKLSDQGTDPTNEEVASVQFLGTNPFAGTVGQTTVELMALTDTDPPLDQPNPDGPIACFSPFTGSGFCESGAPSVPPFGDLTEGSVLFGGIHFRVTVANYDQTFGLITFDRINFRVTGDSVQSEVPEPATLALFGLGLLGLGFMRWRRGARDSA